MALLKKIRSATLLEALVATILIVIVFMVASLVINNLLLNSVKNNTHTVESRIAELEYQARNMRVNFPYTENYNGWDISLTVKTGDDNMKWITVSAANKTINKEIRKTFLHEN